MDLNFPQNPAGFSFFVKISGKMERNPDYIEASISAGLDWQPPGARDIIKVLDKINVHVELGARGSIKGSIKYDGCTGSLSETKVCGRVEFYGRADYRRRNVRNKKGFFRTRFGASVDGGGEVCLDFCSGDVTINGFFEWSAYANFGTKNFNRSFNYGDSYSFDGIKIASSQNLAILKKYCNNNSK